MDIKLQEIKAELATAIALVRQKYNVTKAVMIQVLQEIIRDLRKR